MFAYLPSLQHGWLPAWMLLVSVTSFGNSLQCFLSGRKVSARVYNGKPTEVTELASRFFAAWTTASAFIRLYAAYHITNGPIYDLAWWSYVIALGHYVSEVFVFGSATLRGPAAAPYVVATKSLLWMTLQRANYLG
ncbi:hypothetical protein THASP1DRAFT_23995 [Thamnocephalis sphaerospora]|uniref:Erg28-like protein n=1 Tax=Thamnocephalis sphaerospora TaxID=78915 RepID=A0A4P9XPV4_9FUNG|nr:hypothetical protein THASP1DRAFT_23995 [Thamnocephalis sphaerospora]|eukprot:RKP07922.1 hypothetical protein THASP1DRAFT_23995 [Thamnocephalis sphaerospora]